MRLAHITPISLIGCQPQGGSYLCIRDLVVKHREYAAYYAHKAYLGELVILDNPVHEDVEFDFYEWTEALARIKPTVAVLPDVIDSAAETCKQALMYAAAVREISPNSELMAVPHGTTNEEFLQCVRSLIQIRGVSWLGVSLERRLNDDELALKRRRERVEMIRSNPMLSDVGIHLLGLSERGAELNDEFFQTECTSCDTSKFAVYYLSGIRPVPPVPVDEPYPGRARFGGSHEYFRFDSSRTDRKMFTEYLQFWTDYAIENGDH